MILFPAIDLKEGRCVRLVQGDMDRATVFNDDPADQAATFEAQGFPWLHIVDLDGAFAGGSVNGGFTLESHTSFTYHENAANPPILNFRGDDDVWIYINNHLALDLGIARDGVLTGLNIPMTLALARAVQIPVIASGGLASIGDVERLLEPDCAVLSGAISGRALYDGRIDPAEALALIAGAARSPLPLRLAGG